MKDLQSIINKKATKKLNQDISDFLVKLRDNELWKSISSEFYVSIGEKREELRLFFWPHNSTAQRKMYETMLPKYIERESESFMGKVEQFEENYNDLFEE